MTPELLTEEQVAAIFGVTRHAVRKWRRERKIGFIKVNNTVRFTRSEVNSFMHRNRQAPHCAACAVDVA